MNPGESFTWMSQKLFAEVPAPGGCSKNGVRCAFEDNTGCCQAPDVGVPSCHGIFFVTHLQYLELRLMGEA